MVAQEAIASEKERLYESASLRDDLNDSEAKVLLEWGESQVERLAQEYPDEFEKKGRFLRQLLKNINRFVGQREFNEADGQREYISKFVKYLEPLGWVNITEDTFMDVLPDDKADMASSLNAVLAVLAPTAERDTTQSAISPTDTPSYPDESQNIANSHHPDTPMWQVNSSAHDEVSPSETIDLQNEMVSPEDEVLSGDNANHEVSFDELENPNEHSITQDNNLYDSGDTYSYGEE